MKRSSINSLVLCLVVVLSLVGVGLLALLPERATAVGLVYQGF
jgi:hypothetical protein